MTVADLILAILTELNNAGIGAPSKTKLLKLLYLMDVEGARSIGTTLTGWDWKFLHFGPWTAAYDPVLSDLASYDHVALKGMGDDERATVIVTRRRDVDLQRLSDGTVQNIVARVLSRWGNRELGEILNFVYFETEPMQVAERGSVLNFNTVPRGRYPIYHRTPSDADKATMKAMRATINRPAATAAPASRPYTAPRYDEAFDEALAVLEDD